MNPPEEAWVHCWSTAEPTGDGGWSVVMPLWTTDESPSDLSAELEIDSDGRATLCDVHVL